MLYDEERFKAYLCEKSLKQTSERLDIAKAIVTFEDIFTIDELEQCIRNQGWPVSKATLYRTLPILIESGMIKPIATHQLNNHTFARCSVDDSAIPFKCEKCNTNIKINYELVDDINSYLSDKYDFNVIVDNLLLLKGVCPECVDEFKIQNNISLSGKESQVRILLFEDDQMIKKAMEDYLEGNGYEVISYSDPLEFKMDCSCMDNPSAICADIIITDIKMPSMSGVEFIKKLLAKKCRIKNIAFTSAYWTLEELDFAGEIGAAIFHKPFHITELKKWVEECIANIT